MRYSISGARNDDETGTRCLTHGSQIGQRVWCRWQGLWTHGIITDYGSLQPLFVSHLQT